MSLPKSVFGTKSIEYLSHQVTREGIIAKSKLLKGLKDLKFPSTLKGAQSFLGSLNYYYKFVEHFSVIASVLYKLTDDQVQKGIDLERAQKAFDVSKDKITQVPLLKHPDRSRPFSVIVYANPWAVSAVLGQELDGNIHPVRFTGRTLHEGGLKYHASEKEVLALLRVLNSFYTLVVGQSIKVYTRYSVLKWLMRSKTLQGRCLQWATMLSPWDLEIIQVEKDEDGLAAIFAAGITLREKVDEDVSELIPRKGLRVKTLPISLEMRVDFSGDSALVAENWLWDYCKTEPRSRSVVRLKTHVFERTASGWQKSGVRYGLADLACFR